MNNNNENWINALGTENMSKIVQDAAMYRMVYPEVYYKLQPFIVMMCDEMDAYSATVPSPEMLEHMVNSIYDNVTRLYPDMVEYDNAIETIQSNPYGNPIGFGRGGRRSNLFRDLISIMLLSEIFGRRRRYRW